MINISKRLQGLAITFLLTVIVLVIFFGKIIRDPNNIYFATSGDGLKSYYVALYHVNHDSLYFRTSGMNYPFGEVLPYTDGQPLVVNAIRIFSENILDIREYTVAIINLLMLFSIIFGAVFLYLILAECEVAWWYAAVVSVGIAFLSPQIGRLGGHFSLAWIFWIPMIAWLIIRFDKNRRLIDTLIIGVSTFLSGLMHFYFVAFFGFLIGGYWFYRFLFYRKTSTFWYRDLLHFFLQYIIPVLLLQLLIILNDDVTDRPYFPFGFQSSIAHPVGIFFPSGSPWAFVPKILTVFKHISWESYAYIGTVALAGIVTGLVLFISRIFKKDHFHFKCHSIPVNVFFWISVVALLFSFGIPFVFGLKEFSGSFGFIRQIRVLARFSWLFFYFINIVVFAAVYQYAFIIRPKMHWKILSGIAVLLLWFEGAFNVQGIAVHLNNRIPELEDRKNLSPDNSWIKKINSSDYQAIIPLPYFHIGSENIWEDGSDESKRNTLLVSLKTGLPTSGVILSRTSVSQTFINYALFTEPLERMEVVDYIENEKPFLVLLMNGYGPSEAEKWLIKNAVPVQTTNKFTLLSLSVDQIRRLPETWRQNTILKFENSRLTSRNGFLVSDTSAFFRYVSFDQQLSSKSLRGGGAFTFPARQWKRMVEDTLKTLPAGKKMLAGFWIYHYQKDGCLRANLELVQKNKTTGKTVGHIYTDFFRHIKAFQNEWALVEFEFETKSDDEIIQVAVRNSVLPNADYIIDEFLIREKGMDVWKKEGKSLLLNGRCFAVK